MNLRKEDLVKLIELIKEISAMPENFWFKEQVISVLGNKGFAPQSQVNAQSFEGKLDLIHTYLKIDLERIINYSEFSEPTREQLFRDNIEMLRFQKGFPSHKVDFTEFCRYAHLQAEEMINYFFNKISGGLISEVEAFIRNYSAKYNPEKKPSQIHQIYYVNKLIAFRNAQSVLTKPAYDILFFINEVRNEASHRNSLSISQEDKYLENYYKEGFNRKSINLVEATFKQKDIYNRGQFVIKKRNQNFNEIIEALENLKLSVLEAVKNPPKFSSAPSSLGENLPALAALKEKFDNNQRASN